ncbi:hypothetical protein HanIR_Chr08g0356431 [Helianthus annuus]|nr:hypothetical protein HanIR_Chr08g0356431 [Helianthus annuus]
MPRLNDHLCGSKVSNVVSQQLVKATYAIIYIILNIVFIIFINPVYNQRSSTTKPRGN